MMAVFLPAAAIFVLSNPHREHTGKKNEKSALKFSTFESPPPLVHVYGEKIEHPQNIRPNFFFRL